MQKSKIKNQHVAGVFTAWQDIQRKPFGKNKCPRRQMPGLAARV